MGVEIMFGEVTEVNMDGVVDDEWINFLEEWNVERWNV